MMAIISIHAQVNTAAESASALILVTIMALVALVPHWGDIDVMSSDISFCRSEDLQ